MSHIIVNEKKFSSDSYCINAFDRGLTLGHGLFESILCNNGVSPLLEYHWLRLKASAPLIGIVLPFNFVKLKQMISELLVGNNLSNCKAAIRLTITDGISERGILSNAKQDPTYILTATALQKDKKISMSATIVKTRRNEHSISSQIKNISYLDNILAKKEAVAAGFDEAFILNSQSNLAEGSICNIFIIKDGVVYTPPISDGALPGIIRNIILTKLHLETMQIKEKSITKGFLLDADEVFICNALMGIMPINKLDNKIYAPPFCITTLIIDALKRQFNY